MTEIVLAAVGRVEGKRMNHLVSRTDVTAAALDTTQWAASEPKTERKELAGGTEDQPLEWHNLEGEKGGSKNDESGVPASSGRKADAQGGGRAVLGGKKNQGTLLTEDKEGTRSSRSVPQWTGTR